MQSLQRMIGLLHLFGECTSELTVDELYEELGYTRSTLYRYLKALTDAGFLTSLPGRGYALGPRIIELDYRIRKTDPIILAGRPVMEELAREVSGIALLCRRYDYKVLCVHQETSTDIVRSRYERGLARPMLRGAASVVILANLPSYQLAKFYQRYPNDFAEAGFGQTLADVKKRLKVHRQRGWTTSSGELTKGITGFAAPIFDGQRNVLGSLSLSLPEAQVEEEKIPALVQKLIFGARIISRAVG